MQYHNFLLDNNITDFITLKNKLEDVSICLKVKEFPNCPLAIIIHTPNTAMITSLLSPMLRDCNGIIIEKENLQIIRYVNSKAFDNGNELVENININTAIITPCFEGTLISVFRFDNELYFSTKRAIDASRAKWKSTKSFKELFLECWDNTQLIRDNHCYNFIIQHPENCNIISYETPRAILLNIRKFSTLELTRDERFFSEELIDPTPMEQFNSVDDLQVFVDKNDAPFREYEGLFISDGNYNQKMYFKNYAKAKEITPNTMDPLFSYLIIRQDLSKLKDYLILFPEKSDQISTWEASIRQLTKEIHTSYLNRHVYQVDYQVPDHFKKTVYKLHGIYLSNRDPILLNTVFQHLNQLNEKQLIKILRQWSTYTPIVSHTPIMNTI